MPDASSPFASMTEVVVANAELGHNWFSKEAMEMFGTRIESALIRGRWFITSEKERGQHVRGYTIRWVRDNGEVITVGRYQGYTSSSQAMGALLKKDMSRTRDGREPT